MKASVATDAIKRQNRAAGRQITAPGTRAETQPNGSTEHSLLWGKSEPERPRGREGGMPRARERPRTASDVACKPGSPCRREVTFSSVFVTVRWRLSV